jgi:hypothetical protein
LSTVSAADWTVGPGGTYNYTSIQEAIDNESTLSGDTISVYDDGGSAYTYNENVVVNKANLTVKSQGQVTVNGSSNPSNPVFTVNNHGSYTNIIGFILTTSNYAGIVVNGANNVTLNDITINNCQRGIYLTGTLANITINGTTINGTGSNGIEKPAFSILDTITIQNTQITNPTGNGISLTSASNYLKNVTIDNVTITNTTQEGIYIENTNEASENLTITNTNITNSTKDGLYLKGMKGTIILENNTITHNGYGGSFYGLRLIGNINSNITITPDNIFQENRYGIYLQNVGRIDNPITFTGPQLINNAGYPVLINGANYITITGATFDDATTQIATGARIIDAILIQGTSSNI